MGSFSSKTRSRGRGIFCQEGSDPDHEIVRFSDEHFKNPPSQLSNNENKNQKNQVFVEGYYIEAAADGEEDNNLMRTKSLTEVDLDELKGCLDLGFGFSYDEIPELCNTLPALELCYSMNQRFLDDHQKLPESPAAAVMVANWRISGPGEVSGRMPGFNASLLPCCSSISACNKKNVVATNMLVLYQHALIDSGSSHSFRSSTLPRRVPTNFEPFGRGAISIATRDPPEDVKARLKYWAQVVACTVRLCS